MPPAPPSSPLPEPTWAEVLRLPTGLLGAVLGAVVGGYLFRLAIAHGLYAVPMIGVATATGALALARRGSWALAMIAGGVALAGGLCAQGLFFPLNGEGSDPALWWQVGHVYLLPGYQLGLHGLSTLAAGFICSGSSDGHSRKPAGK